MVTVTADFQAGHPARASGYRYCPWPRLQASEGTDSVRSADEQDRVYERARKRTRTPDQRAVRIWTSGLRLRGRLVDGAPDRRHGADVSRTGRPAMVARRTRRRRGQLVDGRTGR